MELHIIESHTRQDINPLHSVPAAFSNYVESQLSQWGVGRAVEVRNAEQYTEPRREDPENSIELPGQGRQQRHPAVGIVKDYIENNYENAIPLRFLAAITGLSEYHLLRIFRASEGVTPQEYTLRVRIEKARRLLEQGVQLWKLRFEQVFMIKAILPIHFVACSEQRPASMFATATFSKKMSDCPVYIAIRISV